MKVYRFNVESSVYLGEDFCLPTDVADEDGITTIAPPAFVAGHVPVFDQIEEQWKLVQIERFRMPMKPPLPSSVAFNGTD